jgi:hypothetical protein
VIANALGLGVDEVSIEPDGHGHAGHTAMPKLPEALENTSDGREDAVSAADRKAALDEVTITLAGDIAEAKSRGERYELNPNGEGVLGSDERDVMQRIVRMCDPGDHEAQDKLLDVLSARARCLVDEHWAETETLAAELWCQRTLTGAETIQGIIATANA